MSKLSFPDLLEVGDNVKVVLKKRSLGDTTNGLASFLNRLLEGLYWKLNIQDQTRLPLLGTKIQQVADRRQ